MQRTTTTATLLVTVAVSALSGCMTVQQRPPVPGPRPAAPSQPSAPRPEGQAEAQVVQAPVQEALEMVGVPPEADGAARSERPGAERPPGDAARERPRQPERPRVPERPRPRPAHPSPRRAAHSGAGVPDPQDLSREVTREVRKNADVCALGKKYGGWRSGSPEAVICEETYGR
ncbi:MULTISPECIES: hypothetical protein [unclassified Streptomyces]|uniref:hypothetical protein n=1 Tax=unclassified Streptomyces TaxID=2593676 RepID=UPI003D7606F6